MMDEILTIKRFFESHQVHLSTAWLEGCVNWCKEDNPANTIKELQLKVYEQWLLLDLRDVEVPSLPPDLSNKVEYKLSGNYSLQMMKVIDITKPKYWQLQRIRNTGFKNVEPENESSKRVLQLTLTDGVQEVEAMEYTPISCLNINLTPGIKIRLMGPITVRRGRLMLENRNIKILGGEVEELIIPNATENVLARHFNLPLNPKPHVIEESLLSANMDLFSNTGEYGAPNENTRNNVNTLIPNKTVVQNLQAGVKNTSNILPSDNKESEILMTDINDEEEMRIAEQIDMLMEVENDVGRTSFKRKRSESKSPDMFDDQDFNDSIFENIDVPVTVIKTPESRNHLKNSLLSNGSGTDNLNINNSLDLDDDVFENIDIDAHLDQVQKELQPQSNIPQKPSVFTIEKLLQNMHNISNGKFKIKAKFTSIVEKLTVADDEFYLVVKVADETGDLTVRLHDEVLSDMAGYCASALMSLKKGIMENNVEAENKVVQAIKRIKDKLLELNHTVEVLVNINEKFPVIVNILR